MKILGIETSCDETAAAIVSDESPFIRSNVVFSQIAEHRPYGGIVPEIAARAHLDHLDPVIEQALAEAGSILAILRAWPRPAGRASSAASSSA